MPWNKTDRSFKTLINKRVTDSDAKFYFNEKGDFTINTHQLELWVDAIPSTAPGATTDIVEYHNTLTLVEDTSVPSKQAWFATSNASTVPAQTDETSRLKNWVSDKYGSTYEIVLYDTSNVQIPPSDGCGWFFDYQTGILTFASTTTTTGGGGSLSSRAPFKIKGYRYIGRTGLDGNIIKNEVRVATTPATSFSGWTYSSELIDTGVTSTSLTIDGISLNTTEGLTGDRILIKNWSTLANNGIYYVERAGDGASDTWRFRRAPDFNDTQDIFPGTMVFVRSGTVNARTVWSMSNASFTTLDAGGATGEITFAQFITATTRWSALTAPDANLSLSMSTYTTTFNWTTGTSTNNLFSLTTDASANGTGALLNIATGSSSTVLPLLVKAGATTALTINASAQVLIGTLTNGRITYAGASGLLQDSANMTFDGNRIALATTGNTGGLLIGGDANLYRSAADTLKTDDSLIVGVNLSVLNAGTFSLYESGSVNFSSFAAGTQANDLRYTLPTTQPSTNQVLTATSVTGSGPYDITLGWVTNSASITIGDAVNSGTAGSILFVGTGPALAQDNANLYWDDTNNTLGIGTTRSGAISGTNPSVRILGTGTTSSSSAFEIQDSSTATLFFVRNDGYVGIGTNAPTSRLYVVHTHASDASLTLANHILSVTSAQTGQNVRNVFNQMTLNTSGAIAPSGSGIMPNVWNQLVVASTHTGAITTPTYGINSEVQIAQTGSTTHTLISGIRSHYNLNTGAGGTITTADSFISTLQSGTATTSTITTFTHYNTSYSLSGSPVIGTLTGLDIKDPGAGTVTTQYGIRVRDQSRGSTNYALYFDGTSGLSRQGIWWNGDVNLYRSAADTLKTDDSFVVGTNLSVLNAGTFSLYESGSVNFSSFAAGTQANDLRYTLPTTQPSTNQVLSASAVTGSGPYDITLTWVTPATSGVTIGDGITGSTVGSVLFVGAGSTLAQDNANFFWDDTNNTLGIGTTRTGAISGTNPSVRILGTGSSSATSSFEVQDSGTNTILFVRNDSRVGIGTNAPSYDLSLGGESARTVGVNRRGTGAGNNLTLQSGGAQSGGSNLAAGTLILSSGTATGNAAGYVDIYAVNNANLDGGTTDNPAGIHARFGSGRIGLGTSTLTYDITLASLVAASPYTYAIGMLDSTIGSGHSLNIQAGHVTTTADLNGGSIVLTAGNSTGSGSSSIAFYTATAGGSGTTVRTSSLKMTLTGAGQLQVSTTGSSAGILLGGDAQLYRSAADVLRTPDSLTVDASLTVGTLTSTRVTYAGTGGLLQDSANMTFDGNRVALATTGNTGGLLIGGDANLYRSAADTLKTDDSLIVAVNLTVNSLTSGRVTYASTSGLLVDSPNFTFTTIGGQLGLAATGSGGGVLIGGDTQLYRSAADVLRTPDSFTVDVNLTVSGTASIGAAGGTTGTINLLGSTSGTVSVLVQAAAGTYNFNLPTTAGSSGHVLTSGGGGATAMTWTDPASLAVRWNSITSPNGAQSLTMSTHTTTWNWATGTSTNNLFNLTTDASANGTGALLRVATGASSTVVPMLIVASGTTALTVNASAQVLVNSLTSGRVTYAGTNGLLQDSANMTFDGNQLSLVTAGSSGGLLIGSDVQIYRASANTMSFAASDSLEIPSGNLGVGQTAPTSGGRVGITYNATVGSGTERAILYTGTVSAAHTGFYNIMQSEGSTTNSTGTVNWIAGALNRIRAQSTGGTVTSIYGLHNLAWMDSASGTPTYTNNIGAFCEAAWSNTSFTGTATVSNNIALYAFTGNATISGGGTVSISNEYGLLIGGSVNTGISVSNRYGIRVNDPTGSTGTLTTQYGLYFEDLDRASTNYGLYFAGTSGLSRQGIWWNGDVNLYRSAADVLATDDHINLTTSNREVRFTTSNNANGGVLFNSNMRFTAHVTGGFAFTPQNTYTHTTSSNQVVYINATYAPASASSGSMYGVYNGLAYDDTSTTGNFTGEIIGSNNITSLNSYQVGSHTYNRGIAVKGYLSVYDDNSGTGAITTNAYGGWFEVNDETSAARITNAYGLYSLLNAPYSQNNQTRYGLYVDAMPSPGAFTGTTTAAIRLVGTGGARDGILFGSDTNLYRSAADTLKTDDSLVVAVNLTVNSLTSGRVPFASTSGLLVDSSAFTYTTGTGQLALTTTGSGAGILLGGDAQLYRSAADVLRTPDSLTVDVNLTVSGTASIGAVGGTTGTINLLGSMSGTVSVLVQAAAGTYNFNLPTTAGSSGHVLTSGGGGASAMTWTDPASLAVRWNSIANPTGNQSLTMSTNTTTWNWATGTSTNNLFSLTTDASANGTGALLRVATGTSSTVVPMLIVAAGTTALTVNASAQVLVNSLTSTRVTFAGTSGLLTDSSSFTYTTGTGQLTLATSGSGAGLLLGGDAQIYRDAADILRTPDSLRIDVGLGVGAAAPASTAGKAQFTGTNTTINTEYTNVSSTATHSNSSGSDATVRTWALRFSMTQSGTSNFADASTLGGTGMEGLCTFSGSGTAAGMHGIIGKVTNTSSGTLTRACGVLSDLSSANTGAGHITNVRAVDIAWNTAFSANSQVRCALRIGAGPTNHGSFSGSITGGIYFYSSSRGVQDGIIWGTGGDTNLYSSASDTLKTDDSFVVGTNLTVSSLTSTRVPFMSTSGLFVDSANFTYTTGTGQLALATTGSGAGILIGGDTQLYRRAADIMSMAASDSFEVPSGFVGIGTTAPTSATRVNITYNATVGSGTERSVLFTGAVSAAHTGFYNITQSEGSTTNTTGTVNWISGALNRIRAQSTGGTVTSIYGLHNMAWMDSASGTMTYSNNTGVQCEALWSNTAFTGTATVTNNIALNASNAHVTLAGGGTVNIASEYGLNIQASVNTGIVITTRYGIRVNDPTGSTGTLTTQYGLYFEDLDRAGTNYGLYFAGTSGLSRQGIWWNADTNLYRSAADTLRTDDAFVSGSTITGASSLTLGANGGTTGSVLMRGTTSGTVTVTVASAAGTWTMTLPTSGGTNGYVLTTNGSGATSWSAPGIPWTDVTGTSTTAAAHNGYLANNAALVTITLPTPAVGSVIEIVGVGAGGWRAQCASSHTIRMGTTVSASTGYAQSTNQYDCIKIVGISATAWLIVSAVGTIDIT